MKEIVYWDSDCFLGWLQGEPDKLEACSGTVDRAKKREVLIVTSALSLAEVLAVPKAKKIPTEKRLMVEAFFKSEFIRVINVTREMAELAREYVWDKNIMPKDAIHVATAVQRKIKIFETFDKNLVKRGARIEAAELTIRHPTPPAQGKLFEEQPT